MNKKEQEVLDKNNPVVSFYYCKNNKEANIGLHEDIICKSNNAFYTNKERLFRKLLELNDLYYINRFLEEIDFDKERYKDLLMFV